MNMWDQRLIPLLPPEQLKGLYNELCGARGNGWGQNHPNMNWVWPYGPARLVAYHLLVIDEMEKLRTKKGKPYNLDRNWRTPRFRGYTGLTGYDGEKLWKPLLLSEGYPGMEVVKPLDRLAYANYFDKRVKEFYESAKSGQRLYQEQNSLYLDGCLANLSGKGITIDRARIKTLTG